MADHPAEVRIWPTPLGLELEAKEPSLGGFNDLGPNPRRPLYIPFDYSDALHWQWLACYQSISISYSYI